MYFKKIKNLLLAEPQAQLIREARCALANKRKSFTCDAVLCLWFPPRAWEVLRVWAGVVPHLPPRSWALAGLRWQAEGIQGYGLTAELPYASRRACLHTRCPWPSLFREAWSLPSSLQGDTGGCSWPNLQLYCFPGQLPLGCKSCFI